MNLKAIKKWTLPKHYAGAKWPEYYVGLDRHRDSDILTNANFDAFLEELGGESENVTVVRENHFAYGWYEWVAIHQDAEDKVKLADEMMCSLEDYPVLDEDRYSRYELEEEEKDFENWMKRELVNGLPEWLQDYVDSCQLSDDVLFEIYTEAMDRENVYWEEDSSPVRLIASAFEEILKDKLEVKECPECDGYCYIEAEEVTHSWTELTEKECPKCEGKGYLKLDEVCVEDSGQVELFK